MTLFVIIICNDTIYIYDILISWVDFNKSEILGKHNA